MLIRAYFLWNTSYSSQETAVPTVVSLEIISTMAATAPARCSPRPSWMITFPVPCKWRKRNMSFNLRLINHCHSIKNTCFASFVPGTPGYQELCVWWTSKVSPSNFCRQTSSGNFDSQSGWMWCSGRPYQLASFWYSFLCRGKRCIMKNNQGSDKGGEVVQWLLVGTQRNA